MLTDELILVFPSMEYKEQVLQFKNDFIVANSPMNGVGKLDKVEDYSEWLQLIKDYEEEHTKPNNKYVTSWQYLCVRKSDNYVVGMIQIRHYLTSDLLHKGGHIGFCVRPSERKKGYATEMLKLAKKICLENNFEKILITCDKSNIASAKTIVANGGILENEVDEDGNPFQRYWIYLS